MGNLCISLDVRDTLCSSMPRSEVTQVPEFDVKNNFNTTCTEKEYFKNNTLLCCRRNGLQLPNLYKLNNTYAQNIFLPDPEKKD